MVLRKRILQVVGRCWWRSWGSSWALKKITGLKLMGMKWVYSKGPETGKFIVLYETSNKPGGRVV